MSAITSAKSKLGFVGIGYMGRPIAQRLLKSGFRLTAYDRHRTKAEELIPYGGTVAENVAELSSSCDVVLSCLASDEAVLNIYKGADGAFANSHRGSLVIDLSTVSPQTARAEPSLGIERVARRTVGAALRRGGVIANMIDQIKALLEESVQETSKP